MYRYSIKRHIEKNLLRGYENFDDRVWPAGINDDHEITWREFHPPGAEKEDPTIVPEQYFILERQITTDEIDKIEMPLMPGVRINWYYRYYSEPNGNHIDDLVPDWHLDSSSLIYYQTFVRYDLLRKCFLIFYI